MNFDNVILKNQMPIITVYNCTVEYEHEYFHFNITIPFNEEIYNKIQKVPYILYVPEGNKTFTVTYFTGITIAQSAYAETYMTIQGVEGYVQDLGVLTVSKNDLTYLTVTDDPVPYSFNYNYEKELLHDEDALKPWGQGKEKDSEDKWEIDWEQSFIDETEQQFIEW